MKARTFPRAPQPFYPWNFANGRLIFHIQSPILHRLEQWRRDREVAERRRAFVCGAYRRPNGVMGGPCVNCGKSQPEHARAKQ